MMKNNNLKERAGRFINKSNPFHLKYRKSINEVNNIKEVESKQQNENFVPVKRKHPSACPICKKNIKNRIIHFLPQLYKIRHAKRAQRLNLIRKADHCLLKFLSDICFGILKKVVVFPKEVYKRLSEYEPVIYKLGHSTKLPDHKKRELLIQKDGGFLPLILPALASAVFGIIGNLISKKING